jgi:hypothetical protein
MDSSEVGVPVMPSAHVFICLASTLDASLIRPMGIGFVLLFWAIGGTMLSGLAALILGGATASLTRGVTKGRRRAIVLTGLFPFACLAWAAVIFVFQAFVNEGVLHRDPGLGDAWHCPLPNGYEILMIDVTDSGSVYNPKTQPVSDGVGEQEDAVFGVRLVQIAGSYIVGGVDEANPPEIDSKKIDSYFILDCRTGKRTTLPDYDSLTNAVGQLGIRLNLEPIYRVYSRYRFSWFDVFAGILFLGPILITFLLLVLRVVRLLQTRGQTLQTA